MDFMKITNIVFYEKNNQGKPITYRDTAYFKVISSFNMREVSPQWPKIQFYQLRNTILLLKLMIPIGKKMLSLVDN